MLDIAKPTPHVQPAHRNPAEHLTAEFIAALEGPVEKRGPPWRKDWSRLNLPCNATADAAYTGVNRVRLMMLAGTYPTNRWKTFNQARATEGCVQKGEHGIEIVKVGKWTPKQLKTDADDDPKLGFLKWFTRWRRDHMVAGIGPWRDGVGGQGGAAGCARTRVRRLFVGRVSQGHGANVSMGAR